MSDFEKFINDHGYEHTTEESLKAAYNRHLKSQQGILLTAGEFVAEASRDNTDVLYAVYDVLATLYNGGKLTAREVYQYAHYSWCLKDASAIVAYQVSRDKWKVNNCDTEVTNEDAIIRVNAEWGFEASRVKIIGTPYYDATDWQFVRFDCAHMKWLWMQDELYQIYD